MGVGTILALFPVPVRFDRYIAVMRRSAGGPVQVGEGTVGERSVEGELERDAAILVQQRPVLVLLALRLQLARVDVGRAVENAVTVRVEQDAMRHVFRAVGVNPEY